jgi:lysylphosphatidylglycerol synthetase-like protein (DUF2156 family)
MDFRKAIDSAKFIILISLVFNLLLLGATILINSSGYSGNELANASTSSLISQIMILVTLLGNALIIGYGGYRAAKRGNDLATCGMVGLIAYLVVGLLSAVLIFFQSSRLETMAAMSGLPGMSASVFTIIGVVIMLVIGMVVNFIVALFGGALAGAK